MSQSISLHVTLAAGEHITLHTLFSSQKHWNL